MYLPYPLTLVLSSLALRSGHLHHSCLYIYPRGYSSKVGNKYSWKEDDITTVVACPFVLSRPRPVILAPAPRSPCTECMSCIYSRVSVGRLSARRTCSLKVSELGEWTGISYSLSHNRIGSPLTGFRLSKELGTDTRPGMRTDTRRGLTSYGLSFSTLK